MTVAVAVVFFTLTLPGGSSVDINAGEVLTIREPATTQHLTKEVHCIVNLSDGKFIGVTEDCDTVRQRLREAVQEE